MFSLHFWATWACEAEPGALSLKNRAARSELVFKRKHAHVTKTAPLSFRLHVHSKDEICCQHQSEITKRPEGLKRNHTRPGEPNP